MSNVDNNEIKCESVMYTELKARTKGVSIYRYALDKLEEYFFGHEYSFTGFKEENPAQFIKLTNFVKPNLITTMKRITKTYKLKGNSNKLIMDNFNRAVEDNVNEDIKTYNGLKERDIYDDLINKLDLNSQKDLDLYLLEAYISKGYTALQDILDSLTVKPPIPTSITPTYSELVAINGMLKDMVKSSVNMHTKKIDKTEESFLLLNECSDTEIQKYLYTLNDNELQDISNNLKNDAYNFITKLIAIPKSKKEQIKQREPLNSIDTLSEIYYLGQNFQLLASMLALGIDVENRNATVKEILTSSFNSLRNSMNIIVNERAK